MKKRDISLDYIRVIATIMIVVFHFASTFASEGSIFVRSANSTWGGLGTAMFFLLSGYLLRKRHSKIASLKDFYISRWVSIFPPFYIAFIVAYMINVIRLRSFFYQAPAYTLIYTLLGIDNLLKWFGVTSYAIVGEWFTGIIIILYLLFPILNKIMKHAKWSCTVILLVFYVLGISLGWYMVLPDISIISCTFVFWLGMLLADGEHIIRRDKIRQGLSIVSIVCFSLMIFVNLAIAQTIATHVEAVLLFIFLYTLLTNVSEGQRTTSAVAYFSKTSYAVYLVHHYIVFVLEASKKYIKLMNEIPVPMMFIIYIVIVLIVSYMLWLVSDRLVSCIYKKKK